MGYSDVVKKCADMFAAEQTFGWQEIIVKELRKTFPCFTLKLKNGDTMCLELCHRDGNNSPDYPLVRFNSFYQVITAHEAVALAKWILEVLEGLPEESLDGKPPP